MNPEFIFNNTTPSTTPLIHFIVNKSQLDSVISDDALKASLIADIDKKVDCLTFHEQKKQFILYFDKPEANSAKRHEDIRKKTYQLYRLLVCQKIEEFSLDFHGNDTGDSAAFFESLALSAYKFTKYKKHVQEPIISKIYLPEDSKNWAEEKINTISAVYKTRTLVNEPLSFLTATELSRQLVKMGQESGFNVEVFEKNKIESLKMGGLLAVNRGSLDPPTFNILEWKPANAQNSKPIVLVGKGVVFDTGGLSLKQTKNAMDLMKSDMGGAAAVAGTFYAVAKNKLPIHLIGLIPATDNRPGQAAYAPGDVIKMHSGSTVEVLNTDAEGRMILADALHFAKQYEPQLVIDFATLTGAAVRAIGTRAMVYMSKAGNDINGQLEASGWRVFERLVQFPLWEDYGEQLKSEIADLKNIGGPTAGAITAGKFLEHFTDYPWIHIDIAGPAFLQMEDAYRGKSGTGVGVRMAFDFLKNFQSSN